MLTPAYHGNRGSLPQSPCAARIGALGQGRGGNVRLVAAEATGAAMGLPLDTEPQGYRFSGPARMFRAASVRLSAGSCHIFSHWLCERQIAA